MKHVLTAAVAGTFLVGAAQAATVNTTYQVEGNPFGVENLQERVTITSPGFNGTTRAGEFRMTGDNGFGDFAAFCVDIFQYLRAQDTYETGTQIHSASVESSIDRLFSSVYETIDTAVEAAAFQVSLWEVIYDDGSAFDIGSGSFAISNNDAVESMASMYLDGLDAAPTGVYDITYMYSPVGQDIVTASARTGTGSSAESGVSSVVPLPAAGLMLLGGLGGFAAMRRRQKQA